MPKQETIRMYVHSTDGIGRMSMIDRFLPVRPFPSLLVIPSECSRPFLIFTHFSAFSPQSQESQSAVDQVRVPGQQSGRGSRLDPNYLDLGNLSLSSCCQLSRCPSLSQHFFKSRGVQRSSADHSSYFLFQNNSTRARNYLSFVLAESWYSFLGLLDSNNPISALRHAL